MSAAEDLRVEEGLGLSSCAFHLPANDNATPPTSRAGLRPSRRQGGASDARSEERGGGLLHLNGDGNRLDADDLALALESAQTGERVGGEKLVWKYITSDHLGGASHITDSNGDLMAKHVSEMQRAHMYM